MAKNTISPALRQFMNALTTNCMDGMNMACALTRDEARQNHRYKDQTGGVTKATRAIPAKLEGSVITGGIENTSKIGRYLHEGTGKYGPGGKPYTITPKNAAALHWETPGPITGSESGGEHFAKRVVHPGIRPDPWITRAIHKMTPKFFQIMSQAINASVRTVSKGKK
jgi:hypothetical protein